MPAHDSLSPVSWTWAANNILWCSLKRSWHDHNISNIHFSTGQIGQRLISSSLMMFGRGDFYTKLLQGQIFSDIFLPLWIAFSCGGWFDFDSLNWILSAGEILIFDTSLVECSCSTIHFVNMQKIVCKWGKWKSTPTNKCWEIFSVGANFKIFSIHNMIYLVWLVDQ